MNKITCGYVVRWTCSSDKEAIILHSMLTVGLQTTTGRIKQKNNLVNVEFGITNIGNINHLSLAIKFAQSVQRTTKRFYDAYKNRFKLQPQLISCFYDGNFGEEVV